jgi:hypothetical protein
MPKFTVNRASQNSATISQLSIKREWMDETFDRHAYHCFPITLTNGLGWGISFPEDISFIWDGVFDSTPDHVTILSGDKYVSTGRGQATISFNTGLIFQTDESVSLLAFPVPNQFIRGATSFTTLISTSFFKGELPIAWMVTEPDKVITIPAGTPIAAIMPISISNLQTFELTVIDSPMNPEFFVGMENYGEKIQEIVAKGEWSNFYRDGVNASGETLGNHETKAIRLKTHTEGNNEENKISI